ncbi:MAG: AAA family ATPase [Nitrososphaerales archaeon]
MMFTIGEPAPPEYLIDRTEEVDDLVSLLSNPRINYNVALLGYRRVGKTSILSKVEQQLEDRNIIVVRFDVKKNIGAPETFFDRLNKEIFKAYVKHLSKRKRIKKAANKFGNQIIQTIADVLSKKRLKGVSVETSVSADGTVSISPKIEFGNQQPDYQKIMETIFGTAKAFAEESNTRFVIMLDEFQDITKLRRYKGLSNIIDQFRSVIQERGTKVSYVICGSHVHMLRDLLHKGGSSLFMHSKEYPVVELKRENAVELFERYVLARGIKEKDLRALAEQAYLIVGGHPFYLMSLAEAWNEKVKEKIEQTFERELRSPIGSLRLYEDYVLSEDLKEAAGGPMLRTILQILASGRNDASVPLTMTNIANLLNKPAPQLEPYLTELLKFDLVIKNEEDKTYVIRDKVLEQYLKIEADELNKKIFLPK